MLVADRTFIETSLQRTGTDTACPLLSDDIADYPDGIIVPVDKPYRWTSADVVRKIKFGTCPHWRFYHYIRKSALDSFHTTPITGKWK